EGSSSTWYSCSQRLRSVRSSAARVFSLDEVEELIGLVDDDVGVGQLVGGVDAAPRDSDRMEAGCPGGLHVEGRVAHVGGPLGLLAETRERELERSEEHTSNSSHA